MLRRIRDERYPEIDARAITKEDFEKTYSFSAFMKDILADESESEPDDKTVTVETDKNGRTVYSSK